jgi:hypothetical protein
MPSLAEELGLVDDPLEKTWLEAVDSATVTPCFLRTANWQRAGEELDVALQTVFLGESDLEDAIQAAVPIIDQILEG